MQKFQKMLTQRNVSSYQDNDLDVMYGSIDDRLYASSIRNMMSRIAQRQELSLLRLIKTILIKNSVSAEIINNVFDSVRSAQEKEELNVKIDKTISNEKKDCAYTGSL